MDDRPEHLVNQDRELTSFVKLAIAYLGIMAGIAAIAMTMYLVVYNDGAPGRAPIPEQILSITILFYVSLIAVSVASLKLLLGRKRVGAYLAFFALVLSLFAPYSDAAFRTTITYWLAIPNAIVGILLLKSLKELR
jgi:hypothetical protein